MDENLQGTGKTTILIPPTPHIGDAPPSLRRPRLAIVAGIILLVNAVLLGLLTMLTIGTLLMPPGKQPVEIELIYPSMLVGTVEFTLGAVSFLVFGIGLIAVKPWARLGTTITIIIFLGLEMIRTISQVLLLQMPHRIFSFMQPACWFFIVLGAVLFMVNHPVMRAAFIKRR